MKQRRMSQREPGVSSFSWPDGAPPETNVELATENAWLEDDFPIGEAYFQGQTVSCTECKFYDCKLSHGSWVFFHGPCLYLWARKFHGLYGVLLQIPNNCNLIEEDHWKGSKADNKGQIDCLGVYRYM